MFVISLMASDLFVPSTMVILRGNATSNNQNFSRHACGNKTSARHKVIRSTAIVMFHEKNFGPCLRLVNQVTVCYFHQLIFAPLSFPVSDCVLGFMFALTFGDMLLQYKPRTRYFSANNPYVNTLEIENSTWRWYKTSYRLLPSSNKQVPVAFTLPSRLLSFLFVSTFGGMLRYHLFWTL